MIEVKHLRTLMAIKQTGSLVEAASKIHITQSAISHQLKDLENKLSQELILRKTRPIAFTNAGNKLISLAEKVLPQFDNAWDDIKRLELGQSGRLHIAIECHSCYQWLMPAINDYRQHWPDVELDFTGGFHFSPMPALVDKKIDLVVTSDNSPIEGITYIPLFDYEARLAISTQDSLNKLTFIDADDLSNQTLISYPVDEDRLDIFTQLLIPANRRPKDIRHAELTIMMIQLVSSGRGVACLPDWALDEYQQKNYINSKPLGKDGLWCRLYAAVRSSNLQDPYMQEFIAIAKDNCFEQLPRIQNSEEKNG